MLPTRLDLPTGVGFHRRASGSGASSSEQLLTLATDDGWAGFLNPGDPDNRSLRESGGSQFFEEITHGVGSLPKVAQTTAALQPSLSVGAFDQLDGAVFAGDNSGQVLKSATFTAIPQPFYIIVIAKLDTRTAEFGYVVDVNSSGFCAIVKNIGAGGHTIMATESSGPDVLSGSAWAEGEAHILELLANGASSEFIVDGTTVATGDFGTLSADIISLGHRSDEVSPREWNGPIGPMGLFDGNPSTAIRGRMRNKFSELGGVSVS